MPRFWWLMASHEPVPVLLPMQPVGGRERVMAPGGGERSTRAQSQGDKAELRIGRELAG